MHAKRSTQPAMFFLLLFALEKIHKTRGLIIRCLDCFIDFLGIHLTYRENDRRGPGLVSPRYQFKKRGKKPWERGWMDLALEKNFFWLLICQKC